MLHRKGLRFERIRNIMTYDEYTTKIKELTLSADKAGFAFSIDYANDSSSPFLGKKGYYGRYEVLEYYTHWLNDNSKIEFEHRNDYEFELEIEDRTDLSYAQTVLHLEKVALEIVVFTLEHFFSAKELENI